MPQNFVYSKTLLFCHHGVVGKLPAFQPSSLGSIPDKVRNLKIFNFLPNLSILEGVTTQTTPPPPKLWPCKGSSMMQAVGHSPPTAAVSGLRLSHSMWVSRWTNWSLGNFSWDFSHFPCHKFHSTMSPHSSHPICIISFHSSL